MASASAQTNPEVKGNGNVAPTPAPQAPKPTLGERIEEGKISGMVAVARKHGANLFLRDNPEVLTLEGEIGMARELAGIEARVASERYLKAKRALAAALKAK